MKKVTAEEIRKAPAMRDQISSKYTAAAFENVEDQTLEAKAKHYRGMVILEAFSGACSALGYALSWLTFSTWSVGIFY